MKSFAKNHKTKHNHRSYEEDGKNTHCGRRTEYSIVVGFFDAPQRACSIHCSQWKRSNGNPLQGNAQSCIARHYDARCGRLSNLQSYQIHRFSISYQSDFPLRKIQRKRRAIWFESWRRRLSHQAIQHAYAHAKDRRIIIIKHQNHEQLPCGISEKPRHS